MSVIEYIAAATIFTLAIAIGRRWPNFVKNAGAHQRECNWPRFIKSWPPTAYGLAAVALIITVLLIFLWLALLGVVLVFAGVTEIDAGLGSILFGIVLCGLSFYLMWSNVPEMWNFVTFLLRAPHG
jgi:hypothetical protein